MFQPLCITVICNSEDLRHSLTALFYAYDFEVLEFSSVGHCIEETISRSADRAIDEIVVIDLNLAREMELKSLRDLRCKLPGLHKVLAIAPNADGPLGRKAKAAGADCLFERPYMPFALVEAVKQMASPAQTAG
jgi:FixJ family two-component response regulator